MLDKIIRLSVNNPVFVNLTFILVVAAGLLGLSKLPREQFPEVSLESIAIEVLYVGATAQDVEELILRPIEEKLEGVSDVKRVESLATEGAASIVITFNDGTDIQDARAEVEKAVASASDLPEDAETPLVRELQIDLPVMTLALLGDRTIHEPTDRVQEYLANLPGVSGVDVIGLTEPRIIVALDQAKLRSLQIRPALVAQTIRSAKASVPAGTLEGGTGEIFVKTDERLQSALDVAAIPLGPGSPLRLGDVATIRQLDEQPDTRFWVDGEPAIQLVIKREESADPLEIYDEVLAALPAITELVPPNVRPVVAEDYTVIIRDRLDTVVSNGISGAVLVIVMLWWVAGLRQALLAVWGMPFAYLFAILMMDQVDMTLNVISTFGLLIATGIIVDDAIVVIENAQRHMEMGKSRVRAAIDGSNEVMIPVIAAVATTVFAFLPLTMVGGTTGRVMQILPLAVIFCLLGSLLETIILLPGHLAHYASQDSAGGRTAKLSARMKGMYRPIVVACVERRWLVGVATFVAFLATLVLATKMPFQFTAPGKPTELQVSFKLPAGVDREATQAQGNAIREFVLRELGEDSEGGLVRTSKLRVGSVRDPRTQVLETGANTGLIRFEFELEDELIERFPAMVAALETSLATNPDLAAYKVILPQAGPPSGAAISARLRGRDPSQIDLAVAELQMFTRTIEGIRDVDDDRGIGKETFRVRVDPDLAALYGLAEIDVANAVRAAIDGLVATEVSINEQRVEIVVRTGGADTLDRQGLAGLSVTTPDGRVVRLDQVAELERTRELGTVRRRDAQRTVSVTADVEPSLITALAATAQMQAFWDETMAIRYPDLSIQFGGDTEEIRESFADLPGAFMLALGLVYVALALQFRSYVQPLIIMVAVPFGIMGAVLGLFGMGYDLSLFALFGVVALSGIVVNDSLVMVDFINVRRREGADLYQAAVEGALERLRPILSTTLTTVAGLAPLGLGLGGTDEILAPMAISISAGLGISTALVLVVVPGTYVIIEGDIAKLWAKLVPGAAKRRAEQAAIEAEAADDSTSRE